MLLSPDASSSVIAEKVPAAPPDGSPLVPRQSTPSRVPSCSQISLRGDAAQPLSTLPARLINGNSPSYASTPYFPCAISSRLLRSVVGV